MATFWSFGTARQVAQAPSPAPSCGAALPGCSRASARPGPRALAITLLLASLCLPSIEAKGKRYNHPAGFSFELPDKWTVENGEDSAMLLPPGVKVDPARENNPEVYTVNMSPANAPKEAAESVQDLRSSIEGSGITLDDKQETFTKYGVIYIFDFLHPRTKAPLRVVSFVITAKGRSIVLFARGDRAKIQARDKTLREIAATLDYDR